jgi:outer membrane protein OmpA-like peptidoglycan-associated protein/opacity protein-like surface antigen
MNKLTLMTLLLFSFVCKEQAFAQNTQGKWALGLHGGVNAWINDFNKRIVSPGGEIMLRYGIHRNVSIGITGGYEVLKAQETPISVRSNYTYDYFRLDALPAAFQVWVHPAPGHQVSPYLYAGVGGMFFKRKDYANSFVPADKYENSIMVPVGAGIEISVSKKAALVVEAGYRLVDDKTDFLRYKSGDGWATGKVGINIFLGSGDADDNDEDGLTNGEERKLGTNPESAGTDGDGLKDGEEVKRYKTNPLQTDTDGDVLSDGDEVFKYHTDPTKSDTDGDGLSDGDEVLKYHTDPLKLDTDGDGLTDGDEVLKYHADPLKVDTDGDGLSDWDETKTYNTDATKADTDDDGLNDSDEIKKYHTNPLKPDTDGGGVNDGVEVQRKTNPLNPKDDVMKETIILEKGKTVILEGVNFASGSAALAKSSEKTLEKAYNALLANTDIVVEIAGYTDNVGKPEANENLSARRAQSVKSWLVGKGIPANRLTTVGKGMRDPIAPNDSPDGRAQNRRIEFHVRK